MLLCGDTLYLTVNGNGRVVCFQCNHTFFHSFFFPLDMKLITAPGTLKKKGLCPLFNDCIYFFVFIFLMVVVK